MYVNLSKIVTFNYKKNKKINKQQFLACIHSTMNTVITFSFQLCFWNENYSQIYISQLGYLNHVSIDEQI